MTEILKDVSLPYGLEQAEAIAAEFGTPAHVYDQVGMERTAQDMREAFAWNPHYRNFFAVKATPRPVVLDVLHRQGMGFDCSSRTELLMMQRMGIPGEDIFYTSNDTPAEDFDLAIELGATVNIDDPTQVPVFLDVLGDRQLRRVAVRYNPGKLKEGNDIIGEPEEAKYGMDIEQMIGAFALLRQADIDEFGMHTMVASNAREASYFAETAAILLDAVDEIEAAGGPTFSFVNLGGGFGLNYRPEEAPFDLASAGKQIHDVFESRGRADMEVVTENGRYVTGRHGSLLTRVRYVMDKYRQYVAVDASMNNLMRPGMYGAYHHLTVLGKENRPQTHVYDVSGALCENNDKFAIDRALPRIEQGDLMAIHDAGGHGSAMGFNYNGLLHAPEVIIRPDGSVELIRHGQTFEQLTENEVWPHARPAQ